MNIDVLMKVIEVGKHVVIGVFVILFFVVLAIAWRTESSAVVYPWEKAERREAKRRAKAEAKAQKEFWK